MDGKIDLLDLVRIKESGEKIAAVSCYDYTTAGIVADAGVEMILVGDSAAQVLLGHSSTLPVSMDFMTEITQAVRRAAPGVYLVADMPFLSYQTGTADAIKNAGRFIAHCNADMVKIEASVAQEDVIKAVSDAGIAVMAHIGIRPQSVARLGKLKAQGTTVDMAADLLSCVNTMISAGAGALLIEGTAREVAGQIAKSVSVPVISCGSGPDCDGQILIISDILGLNKADGPKFSKKFANLRSDMFQAVGDYVDQVKKGIFPDDQHCYHMKPHQLEQFNSLIRER